MKILQDADWESVQGHYEKRMETHQEIIRLLKSGQKKDCVELLLGISNEFGNFSANEHKLGPKIIWNNHDAINRVFNMALKFNDGQTKPSDIPKIIKNANITYLKIGVGSEASCMINPNFFWTSNTRTIWTHLVMKHNDDLKKANDELKLYRTGDESSEMAYRMWADIHREISKNMFQLAEHGAALAAQKGMDMAHAPYLWADAISNELYAKHAGT